MPIREIRYSRKICFQKKSRIAKFKVYTLKEYILSFNIFYHCIGQFENGKYNGFGIYSRSDGVCFEGSFQDGRAYGNGKISYTDGGGNRPRSEGVFEGNRLVKREASTESIALANQAAKEASRMKLNRSKAKSLPH